MLGLGKIQKQLYIYGVAKIFWRSEILKNKNFGLQQSRKSFHFWRTAHSLNVGKHAKTTISNK